MHYSKARPGFASRCRQCRKCVTACPQHIDIPAALTEVKRELEGPLLPLMRAAVGAFERFDRRRSLKSSRA